MKDYTNLKEYVTFRIGNQSPSCWNRWDIVAYRTSKFQPPDYFINKIAVARVTAWVLDWDLKPIAPWCRNMITTYGMACSLIQGNKLKEQQSPTDSDDENFNMYTLNLKIHVFLQKISNLYNFKTFFAWYLTWTIIFGKWIWNGYTFFLSVPNTSGKHVLSL